MPRWALEADSLLVATNALAEAPEKPDAHLPSLLAAVEQQAERFNAALRAALASPTETELREAAVELAEWALDLVQVYRDNEPDREYLASLVANMAAMQQYAEVRGLPDPLNPPRRRWLG